jgi:hypothetical protein
MFPKVKKAKLDLEALGEEIAMLKETKKAQMAGGNAKAKRSKNSSARP